MIHPAIATFLYACVMGVLGYLMHGSVGAFGHFAAAMIGGVIGMAISEWGWRNRK